MLDQFAQIAASVVTQPYSEQQVNLVLTFQVSTGEWRVDAVGNEYEVTAPVEVRVTAREDKQSQQGQNTGLNSNTLFIKGRCVNPLLLPGGIKPTMVAAAVMIDRATGQELHGEFTLSAIILPRYAVIDQNVGSRIKGTLKITGGGIYDN